MAILNENGLSHTIEKIVNLLKGKSSTDHKHTKSDITDLPTLGTASSKDVASSGNASTSQVVMGNDTRLTDSRKASDVSEWAKASTKPTYTASEVGASPTGHTHDDRYYTESEIDSKLKSKLSTSLKGSASGLAELDSTGKVPSAQLPSFVDDVIEGYLSSGKLYKESAHTTEIPGESGKIYIDLSTEKTYRWSGSAFVVISDTIALGETSTTAYRGDRGKTAYDHSQSTHARTDATKVEKSSTNGNIKINGTETTVYTHPSGTNPHGTTKSDVGLGDVDNTADADKRVKYATTAGSANTVAWSGVNEKPAVPESGDYTSDNIEALLKKIMGLTPRMGSTRFTKDTHVENTWWNFFYIPHRNGVGMDNGDYGTLLLFPMVGGDGISYIVRAGKGGVIESLSSIITSSNISSQSVNSAATVNGHTVNSDVPANAKFTDTIYDDTEIKKSINDIEIGGRNLARYTNQGIVGWGWSMQNGNYNSDEVVENGIRTCKLTRGSVAHSGWNVIFYKEINRSKWEPKTIYTVSFDVKSNVNTVMSATFLRISGTDTLLKNIVTVSNNTKANQWSKMCWIMTTVDNFPTTTDQYLYLSGMDSSINTWYQFKNLKIEKGNKATDWTPAPEDIENEMDNSIIELSMLGWSVPMECPIQNEVNVNQFIQKVGRVDLGSLNWKYDTATGHERFRTTDEDTSYIKPAQANNVLAKAYSNIYVVNSADNTYSHANNKAVAIDASSIIWAYDTSYTDATAFKSAMQGQYLYYELATPITTTIDGNEITTAVATTTANGLMSKDMVTKLNGIATNANLYTHPTTSGNKHIPSGGSSGQILRWYSDGTATWGAESNSGTPSINEIRTSYVNTGCSVHPMKELHIIKNLNTTKTITITQYVARGYASDVYYNYVKLRLNLHGYGMYEGELMCTMGGSESTSGVTGKLGGTLNKAAQYGSYFTWSSTSLSSSEAGSGGYITHTIKVTGNSPIDIIYSGDSTVSVALS